MEAELASLGAIILHFLGYLPSIATAAAILWYVINIWESHTVRNLCWWRRRVDINKDCK